MTVQPKQQSVPATVVTESRFQTWRDDPIARSAWAPAFAGVTRRFPTAADPFGSAAPSSYPSRTPRRPSTSTSGRQPEILVRRAAYSPRSCRTTPMRGRFLTPTATHATPAELRARGATCARAISIPLSTWHFSSSYFPCDFAVAKARSPEVLALRASLGFGIDVRCLGQCSSGERVHDSRLGFQRIAGIEARPCGGRLVNLDIHHVSRKKPRLLGDEQMLPCNKKSVNPSSAIIA